jgi:hypothetical protein
MIHIHDNPEEAAEVGKNAMDFAKTRSWDLAATQFEELIDKALDTAIHLDTLLDKDKQNVVFINETTNFGQMLDIIPALKEVVQKNKENVNFLLATKPRNAGITSKIYNEIDVIDIDKMWLDQVELSKYRVQLSSISEIPAKYESALPIYGADNMLSWTEMYHKALGAKFSPDKLRTTLSSIDPDPYDFGDSTNKMKIAFIVDTRNANSGIPIDTWSRTIKFLKKFKDVYTISVGNKEDVASLDSDMEVFDKTLSQLIALFKRMDCIVTSDEEYIHLANYLDVPFIIIQGPRKLNHITKHSLAESTNGKKLIYFVDGGARYQQCMPCWKNQDGKCVVTGNPRAHCMETISAGEIFGKILNLRDLFVSKSIKK